MKQVLSCALYLAAILLTAFMFGLYFIEAIR